MNGKTLAVLGSTGSIGAQALEVARAHSIPVVALAAGRNAAQLEEQIREFRPTVAALADENAARDLRCRVADLEVRVLGGAQGIDECAACGASVVLNAIVGIAGLSPTVCAVAAGSDIALANKETLVAGGSLVTEAVSTMGVNLLPVDSEHSAIFQCLQGAGGNPVKSLILTASGGPFFGKSRAELEGVTLADALKHPNWSMGAKITVDSATMFNKGLELIEAVRLFDVQPQRVKVLVHRQSVVHSLVEYEDGALIAQLGIPDMKIPIQYALSYPQRLSSAAAPPDLTAYAGLTFEKTDDELFPAIELARRACALGGLTPAVYNGANEEANALFRAGKISFLRIAELVAAAIDKLPAAGYNNGYTLSDVFNIDSSAREFVRAQA
ncbi:MAG: 1-deoxy-D-xylulose-5-phosphate reductoisomerase [Clostridium sp.]|jgi:1-deoxy-D-xylulose-5-phosphate reductoisomerase|nr:1-deoxy-D-xylulose-5-phosphate reductoisomerase [Clostridium sp.]